MRFCSRIAAVRRQVKRLAALAAERAAQADRSSRSTDPECPRAAPSFRPLGEAEAEALVGGELLAALAGARRP